MIPQKILTPTLDKEYNLTLNFLTKEELTFDKTHILSTMEREINKKKK